MTATSERIGRDAMTRQSRRIYRGIPKEKSAFANVGSIPAEFRTLLNPKPLSASHRAVPSSTSCRREKDAFGGRVPRFVEKSEASPGPGAYHAGKEGMNWRYDGLSSRGYGPIASQNERFAKCHARQFLGPGGGARGNARDVEFLVRAGSYDPSMSTRGSAPIMRRPPRRRDAPDGGGLGPGSYCTQKCVSSVSGVVSEWRSGLKDVSRTRCPLALQEASRGSFRRYGTAAEDTERQHTGAKCIQYRSADVRFDERP